MRIKHKKKKPEDKEHIEQAALFEWAHLARKQFPALEYLHAIPNGGHRHISVAVKLKKEGVKSGVPDVFLDVSRGGFHGLRLEMKHGKNTTSPEQNDWIEHYTREGYLCEVCYSWVEARDILIDYLGGAGEKGKGLFS